MLALATTILSTAITLTGMSVIVHRKQLWLTGLALGAAGAVLVLMNATAAFAA